MMKISSIDQFLRTYTTVEEEALARELRGCETGDGEPGLLFGRDFMKDYEEIGIYKNNRFMPVKEHFHDYIELTYVWSGSFVQCINGKRVVCERGDVCILNTQAAHSLERCEEEDIIVNILMRKELFDHAFVGRLARQGVVAEFLIESVMEWRSRHNYLVFHTEQVEGFRDLIARIIGEYYSDRLGRREMLRHYTSVMFIELLRSYDEAERNYARSEKSAIVFQVLEYIEKNDQSCTLIQAAETFGFHPNYMTTMLKEMTGRSFLEHVQEQRLNKARNLLAATEVPVADIVSLCGYQNLSFFYRKFKAAEGVTPAEYRKRSKGAFMQ